MVVEVSPSKLTGTITPPPSKSQAHRLIIAAALAKGESHLSNIALSKDISATIDCMRALGAKISEDGTTINGIDASSCLNSYLPQMDCCESGSTLRFLIPVALAVAGGGAFSGQGRLMERPQKPYEMLFAEKGICFERKDGIIQVKGRLQGGVYHLPGDVSSQFITGLMYALPLLKDDSEIILTSPLESRGYIDMTVEALCTFGVEIQAIDGGWYIPGGQHYQARDCAVESDFSQAAFFYAANLMGSELNICGMNPNSTQGDRVILDYMHCLSQKGEVTLDVSQCPDLVPPLAVMAALREGEITHIVGAARLRIKESDRLDTITTQLNALNADVKQDTDRLMIQGVHSLRGGIVSGCNDHRIAMMLAIAATRADGLIRITGAECVEKSYPNFWDDYARLGGKIKKVE